MLKQRGISLAASYPTVTQLVSTPKRRPVAGRQQAQLAVPFGLVAARCEGALVEVGLGKEADLARARVRVRVLGLGLGLGLG